MRNQIIRYYKKRVRESNAPDELKRSLLNHDAAPLFLDRAYKELVSVGRHFGSLPEHRIKQTINALTDMFLHRVKVEADRRAESILSRIQREEEQKKQKEIAEAAKGNITGEFEEAGLKIVDRSVE